MRSGSPIPSYAEVCMPAGEGQGLLGGDSLCNMDSQHALVICLRKAQAQGSFVVLASLLETSCLLWLISLPPLPTKFTLLSMALENCQHQRVWFHLLELG